MAQLPKAPFALICRPRRSAWWVLPFWLCVLHAATGAGSTPQERFAEARAAFEKGDFRRAQYLAEALLGENHLSPQLFQLLGNARYRQGDMGRAALWYDRALLFPPPSAETRQNLAHIHERTGNFSFPSDTLRSQIAAWYYRSDWLALAIACAWVWGLAHLLAYLYARRGNLRVLLLTIAVVAVAAGTVSTLAWFWHPSYAKIRDLSIVTSKDARAYTAASTTSGSVVQLPPGSQVRKLENRGAWCYVEIPTDGENRRGWVPSEALSDFWPFNAAYLE